MHKLSKSFLKYHLQRNKVIFPLILYQSRKNERSYQSRFNYNFEKLGTTKEKIWGAFDGNVAQQSYGCGFESHARCQLKGELF